MINLLPKEYKREMKERKKWKTLLNLEFFLFSFLLILLLIMIFLEITGQSLLEYQEEFSRAEERLMEIEKGFARDLEISGLNQEVREANQKLLKMDSTYGQSPDLPEILQRLAGIIPLQAYFTFISYERETGQFSAYGFCPDREVLFQLKKTLEKDKKISGLSFPAENWLTPQNFKINFEVNESR